jgi:hypothetical protein
MQSLHPAKAREGLDCWNLEREPFPDPCTPLSWIRDSSVRGRLQSTRLHFPLPARRLSWCQLSAQMRNVGSSKLLLSSQWIGTAI